MVSNGITKSKNHIFVIHEIFIWLTFVNGICINAVMIFLLCQMTGHFVVRLIQRRRKNRIKKQKTIAFSHSLPFILFQYSSVSLSSIWCLFQNIYFVCDVCCFSMLYARINFGVFSWFCFGTIFVFFFFHHFIRLSFWEFLK